MNIKRISIALISFSYSKCLMTSDKEIQSLLEEESRNNIHNHRPIKQSLLQKSKLEIFLEALDIIINMLFYFYIMYQAYWANTDWLPKEQISSYYNSLNILITIWSIYLLLRILFFIYEFNEFNKVIRISTYILMPLAIMNIIYTFYKVTDMNKTTKEKVYYTGHFFFPVVVCNMILLWGREYTHKQSIKRVVNSSLNSL